MSSPNSKFVVFDCDGWGLRHFEVTKETYRGENKLAFVTLSSAEPQIFRGFDQGLPPPAVRPCNLTAAQRQEIMDCNESRPVLISFAGQATRSQPRKDLAKLNNNKDILLGGAKKVTKWMGIGSSATAYEALSRSSSFGAAPRGDNLFSYRFSEAMSCGAIPVVYADNWVLPFGYDLINWQDVAVVIPEAQANESIGILNAIPKEKRCAMRQRVVEIYDKYMKDGPSTVAGLIENLELFANRPSSLTGPVAADVDLCDEAAVGRLAKRLRLKERWFDKTLCWDEDVERLWFAKNGTRPKSMILMTSLGWNNPVTAKRKGFYRGLRTRQLMEEVINHPLFYPGAWDLITSGQMNISQSTIYYIFLDKETCGDTNYPHPRMGRIRNADTVGGRSGKGYRSSWSDFAKVWRTFFDSARFRVVYLDCDPSGPPTSIREQQGNRDRRLVVMSFSAMKHQHLEGTDEGLPPPTLRSYKMSSKLLKQARRCKPRKVLLSFSGNLVHPVRKALRHLHDGKDVIIGTPSEMQHFFNVSDPYFGLAQQSSFAAVPRGDTLATSRLVEVMSAGAIPVILADQLVLPLTRAVNWTEISVTISEKEAAKSVEILKKIPGDQQCQMRKKLLEVYDKYFSSPKGNVQGMVDILETTFDDR
mmetsp:Transcript_25694/g.59676  ORF Transcript_25694/g.59676 Transcript_25694/m.59676 type:complete len:645 (-) Transcript_25694:431-2365(-)